MLGLKLNHVSKGGPSVDMVVEDFGLSGRMLLLKQLRPKT